MRRKISKSLLNSNNKSKIFIKIVEILIDTEGNAIVKYNVRTPTNLIKQEGNLP